MKLIQRVSPRLEQEAISVRWIALERLREEERRELVRQVEDRWLMGSSPLGLRRLCEELTALDERN